MRSRNHRAIVDRTGLSRLTTSRTSSTNDFEERMNRVRNEVNSELLRRRLLNFIKHEHELEVAAASSNLKNSEAEPIVYCSTITAPKQEPVPAFPPVEASVDLGWYQYEDIQDYEEEDRESMEVISDSGIQLILTPLKTPEADPVEKVSVEDEFQCETPPLNKSQRNNTATQGIKTAIVQSRKENQQMFPEIVFIDEDDDDSTSCETLSSASTSEYDATP